MQFRVAQEPWSDRYGVLVELTPPGAGARFVAAPAEFNAVLSEEGSSLMPTFSLRYSEARDLLDALLAAGVLPSSEPETRQELGAVQKHLADLRALLWHELGVKG